MTDIILKVYDFINKHKRIGVASLLILSLVLIVKLTSLNYKEDISAFLPLDNSHQNALKVYQDISGAKKIFAVFQYKDSTKECSQDTIVETINAFAEDIEKRDTNHIVKDLTTQVDLEKISEVSSFVYENIPYFLDKKDYAHIDSLLNEDNYIRQQLQQDKQMLMFPSGGLLSENIQRDPLNLFTPVVSKLQKSQSGLNYEMYDGYIFSPDMQKAIVMLSSPFGSSETENNSTLISLLKDAANKATSSHKDIEVHIIGGPVIAVGNASQIKSDSIWAVSISIILILALLLFCFRNATNLLLIVVSIAWGWFFAMGALAFVHNSISVIVIGISSVILGIAVNYPLHLIAHLSHSPNIRTALKEIVAPLVVGNITTVAAFLCLVPLQSSALRDLGLFSSFLLVGTILFVLFYLPHVIRHKKATSSNNILNKVSDISLENKPYIVIGVSILTIIFGYFSLDTKFDANMGHINYMTDEQKEDMAYFQKMMHNSSTSQSVYVVSEGSSLDEALDKSYKIQPQIDRLKADGKVVSTSGCTQFLTSKSEQKKRLQLWNNFISKHYATIKKNLQEAAIAEGFAENSFDDFYSIMDRKYAPQNQNYFNTLVSSVFSSNLSIDSVNGSYNVVDVLSANKAHTNEIEKIISDSCKDSNCFDVESMNSAIANNLSSNFNYIGWACGLIVFFFLWFSFGSVELAALSFLPMAVSWIWILGLMSIFDIQFNIVNIILATFIFGQGDDYTIFMTEGSCYEYAYRKKMLASYKNSIIISALIMFIGIGTLIIAKHPALHSLAEVTIVGMLSVVLMAYIFPPLIFNSLVKSGKEYRKRPVSLRPTIAFFLAATVFFIQLATVYIVGTTLLVLLKATDKRKAFFHRYVQRLFAFDMKHLPSVKLYLQNTYKETFDEPAIIISNHQSMLDSACFMALSSKLIIIANKNATANWVNRKIFKWLDFYTISDEDTLDIEKIRALKDKGYSIVMFPEGARNESSSILRFHKGAFYLAELLDIDIVPVFMHGLNDVLPRNSVSLYPGSITISIEKRIKKDDLSFGATYVERTKSIHGFYTSHYKDIAKEIETAGYYHNLVLDRYRYKGVECFKTIKSNLKRFDNYSEWIDTDEDLENVFILDNGYGELALLFALVHKDANVFVFNNNEDNRLLLKYSAEGTVDNISLIEDEETFNSLIEKTYSMMLYVVDTEDGNAEMYKKYKPTLINTRIRKN